ncbi:1,4-alpha-glucan branching enzyme, partial [Pseudoalteromonas sp. S327]
YVLSVYLLASKNLNIIINEKQVNPKRYNSRHLFIATSNEMPTHPYKFNVEYANSSLFLYEEYSFSSILDTDEIYLFHEGSLED